MSLPADEYDSPWKIVVTLFIHDFLQFFFPLVHSEIDWSKGYEFLDKELQEISRDAETGLRIADKLVKVWLKSGKQAWLIIHIEIQGKSDPDFALRMFVYNFRAFDLYRNEVISLAVLTDTTRRWRPGRFQYGRAGSLTGIKFPIVKLLDLEERWAELEESDNPFAIVVMAHLRTVRTRKSMESRLEWKLRLVRMLYDKGWDRQRVLELLRFIDWVMAMPPELERRFDSEIRRLEEGRSMPYLSRWELGGMARAKREDLRRCLQIRFGTEDRALDESLESVADLQLLNELLDQAFQAQSLDDFRNASRRVLHADPG